MTDSTSPKVPGAPPAPPARSKRGQAPNSGRRRNRRADEYGEYDNQYDGEYDDEEEEPVNLMEETPETVVGEKVVVKGNLAFETLLRIDGKVEGTLDCDGGNLIIGQTGTLVGNVEKMKNMLVDGTVIGDISVEKLELHAEAMVYGNITCQTLFLDHNTKVVGTLNVHPLAPQMIDAEGNIKGDTDKKGKKDKKKAEEEEEEEEEGGDEEWQLEKPKWQLNELAPHLGLLESCLRESPCGWHAYLDLSAVRVRADPARPTRSSAG
eukprot:CAMPEP_0182556228 /NCGR_PEP_ID=MMETSP1324-20130603/566_1 /TAXON_ID=236786 /ORGANISM="Florenciella sp., Strain RCC1587" /LENGTH=264 /DNA_ID=CAMNT_0024768085 /DNA_START=21 /DNA_END=813 /DNA_ORIENTATION=-